MEKVKYLVIGNSAAAIGALEAIREVDKEGSILILSDEPYHVYSRPLISEHLAYHRPLEKMLYRDTGYYQRNNINKRLGVSVTGIDPVAKTATLDGEGTLKWEKLLLATGGAPILPPLKGMEKEGVFTFTRLDDAKSIDDYLDSNTVTSAVVVGGGLIGVSVTEALVKREVPVTVVEMKDRLLNTILDGDSSAVVESTLRRAGVSLETGRTVVSINKDRAAPGKAGSITLDDGRRLFCQLVILAIGVKPRIELVEGAGIEVDRGICVDRHMQTSVKDIYAAGDAAQAYDFIYCQNRVVPIWPNAYSGGRVAGLNMAGVKSQYDNATVMNSLKYFGLAMTSIGIVAPAEEGYEVICWHDSHFYRKIVLKDGQVVGMVFTGDVEYSGVIFSLMKDKVDVSPFKEKLVSPDFNLACLPEDIRREKLSRISL